MPTLVGCTYSFYIQSWIATDMFWCDHLSFTFAAPKEEQFFSFRYFSIGRELFRNDLKTLVLKHVIQVFSNLAGLVKMSESGFQSVSLPPQLHLVLVSKS